VIRNGGVEKLSRMAQERRSKPPPYQDTSDFSALPTSREPDDRRKLVQRSSEFLGFL
jgi:hypothetical protein